MIKKLAIILASIGAITLTSCEVFDKVSSVDIDKYSATGQCIIGCIESHGEVDSPPVEEIRIVE